MGEDAALGYDTQAHRQEGTDEEDPQGDSHTSTAITQTLPANTEKITQII